MRLARRSTDGRRRQRPVALSGRCSSPGMITARYEPAAMMGRCERMLDLLLPATCAGCGVEGQPLCARCARPLASTLDEPPGIPVGLAIPLPAGLVQLEWCAAFTGPVRAAIHAHKYRGERRLAEPLGWRHRGTLGARRAWRRPAGAGAGPSVTPPGTGVRPGRRHRAGLRPATGPARVRVRWSAATGPWRSTRSAASSGP